MLDKRIAEIGTTVAELLALREILAATRQRAADCTDKETVAVCAVIQGGPENTAR